MFYCDFAMPYVDIIYIHLKNLLKEYQHDNPGDRKSGSKRMIKDCEATQERH